MGQIFDILKKILAIPDKQKPFFMALVLICLLGFINKKQYDRNTILYDENETLKDQLQFEKTSRANDKVANQESITAIRAKDKDECENEKQQLLKTNTENVQQILSFIKQHK